MSQPDASPGVRSPSTRAVVIGVVGVVGVLGLLLLLGSDPHVTELVTRVDGVLTGTWYRDGHEHCTLHDDDILTIEVWTPDDLDEVPEAFHGAPLGRVTTRTATAHLAIQPSFTLNFFDVEGPSRLREDQPRRAMVVGRNMWPLRDTMTLDGVAYHTRKLF